MAPASEQRILDIGLAGARLAITVADGDLFAGSRRLEVRAEAHPWSGTITGALTRSQLAAFAAGLDSDRLPRTVTLGGGRGLELEMAINRQNTGIPQERRLAIEAWLTASGDDPWPRLNWLIFDVEAGELAAASARLAAHAG